MKPHPFLELRDPAGFYAIAELAEKKPHVFLLSECPLVYPILALADVFLGDFSSVGYDALAFQIPLYFFPTERPGRLYQCGQIIDPSKELYGQLEKHGELREAQRALYHYAFGPERDEESIRLQINQLINS